MPAFFLRFLSLARPLVVVVRSSLEDGSVAVAFPEPANTDGASLALTPDQRMLSWLFRRAAPRGTGAETPPPPEAAPDLVETSLPTPEDWAFVASLCGYTEADFRGAGRGLPLTAAEIDHFRRNHRDMDPRAGRDFMAARLGLPSPLAELYSLYRHRARLDVEATLFVAQATGSARISRIMADLLALGGFALGHETLSHGAMTYAVPVAFDTAELVDKACREAERRLALPATHPVHLLKLSPDDAGILAANIVANNLMTAGDFLEKANLLAEARQDVARLAPTLQFVTALRERDLSPRKPWVARLCAAYARLLPGWVADSPEIQAVLGPRQASPSR